MKKYYTDMNFLIENTNLSLSFSIYIDYLIHASGLTFGPHCISLI